MYGLVMIASGPGTTLKPSLAAATWNRAPEDFIGTGGTGYSFDMGATNGESTRCPEMPISHSA